MLLLDRNADRHRASQRLPTEDITDILTLRHFNSKADVSGIRG
jgi:hypothetical protein